VWQVKQTVDKDKGKASAEISAIFMLPAEFRANDDEVEEDGEVAVARWVCQVESATIEKPEKQLHLKALYLKGFIDGKSLTKMLADEVVADEDWGNDIIKYLKILSQQVSRKLRYKALKFVHLDDQLFHRTIDGVVLKCLNQEEVMVLMGKILCAHQSAHKMKWMIRRAGYFWPTILEDCFKYYKGCQECQTFEDIKKSPA